MKRKNTKRLISCIFWLYMVILVMVLIHCFRKSIIAERFNIPTTSMTPTLVPEDKVWVNKLLMGGRLYATTEAGNSSRLKSFRLPGIRDIKPGDIICFNNPHGTDDPDNIAFCIDRIFCKRVLGTPGDRIGAVDGHYWNDRALRPVGVVEEQEKLRWMFDSAFVWMNCYDVIPLSRPRWNIKNWGPLTVPAKGQKMELDDFSRELYRQVIEYESGDSLDGSLTEYTFQGNYYFAVGDNVMSSYDSRYWGFIPEEFIIGIVSGITQR